MLVIPAIDIRGGKCVRLRQGDFAQETVFGDNPAEIARRWAGEGASLLHVVDLDGARAGRLINVEAIRSAVDAAGIPCQLGGGLRTEADIATALDLGVERVVIGTQALKEPGWFAEMARKYGGKLLLGLDARNGCVATEGWSQTSDASAVDLARRFDRLPLSGIIYTDISRDGMLQGPNFRAVEELARAVALPVFASGGITTIRDVQELARLPIAGFIVGRALYEGTLDLRQSLATVLT